MWVLKQHDFWFKIFIVLLFQIVLFEFIIVSYEESNPFKTKKLQSHFGALFEFSLYLTITNTKSKKNTDHIHIYDGAQQYFMASKFKFFTGLSHVQCKRGWQRILMPDGNQVSSEDHGL